MSDLLNNPRQDNNGSSIEDRVSALENYIAILMGTNNIADGAITSDKIQNNAVSDLKIAAAAVTAAKTSLAAINSNSGNINYNQINANMIQAGAITSDKIYAGAITSDKITVSTLAAISANIGNITAGTLTGVTIQTAISGNRIVLGSNKLTGYANNTTYPTFGLDGSSLYWSDGSNDPFGGSSGASIYYSGGSLYITCNYHANWTTLQLDDSGNISIGNNLYVSGNISLGGKFKLPVGTNLY